MVCGIWWNFPFSPLFFTTGIHSATYKPPLFFQGNRADRDNLLCGSSQPWHALLCMAVSRQPLEVVLSPQSRNQASLPNILNCLLFCFVLCVTYSKGSCSLYYFSLLSDKMITPFPTPGHTLFFGSPLESGCSPLVILNSFLTSHSFSTVQHHFCPHHSRECIFLRAIKSLYLVKVKAWFSTELTRRKDSHNPGFIHFSYSLSSGSHAPRALKKQKAKILKGEKEAPFACVESSRPRSFQKRTHHFGCPEKCLFLSSYHLNGQHQTQSRPFANLLSHPDLRFSIIHHPLPKPCLFPKEPTYGVSHDLRRNLSDPRGHPPSSSLQWPKYCPASWRLSELNDQPESWRDLKRSATWHIPAQNSQTWASEIVQ